MLLFAATILAEPPTANPRLLNTLSQWRSEFDPAAVAAGKVGPEHPPSTATLYNCAKFLHHMMSGAFPEPALRGDAANRDVFTVGAGAALVPWLHCYVSLRQFRAFFYQLFCRGSVSIPAPESTSLRPAGSDGNGWGAAALDDLRSHVDLIWQSWQSGGLGTGANLWKQVVSSCQSSMLPPAGNVASPSGQPSLLANLFKCLETDCVEERLLVCLETSPPYWEVLVLSGQFFAPG